MAYWMLQNMFSCLQYDRDDWRRATKLRTSSKQHHSQHLKYIGHLCRAENTALTKILFFAKSDRKYYRDPWGKISGLLGVSSDEA